MKKRPPCGKRVGRPIRFFRLLRTPRQVDANGDLIFHGHGEERRRVDLEVRERCGDCADDVLFPSLRRHFE